MTNPQQSASKKPLLLLLLCSRTVVHPRGTPMTANPALLHRWGREPQLPQLAKAAGEAQQPKCRPVPTFRLAQLSRRRSRQQLIPRTVDPRVHPPTSLDEEMTATAAPRPTILRSAVPQATAPTPRHHQDHAVTPHATRACRPDRLVRLPPTTIATALQTALRSVVRLRRSRETSATPSPLVPRVPSR